VLSGGLKSNTEVMCQILEETIQIVTGGADLELPGKPVRLPAIPERARQGQVGRLYGPVRLCFQHRDPRHPLGHHQGTGIDWSRTVFIDVGEEIGFTDFDLTDDQQNFLVEARKSGVQKFLK